MMGRIVIRNGKFNRFEILDKIDVLRKLYFFEHRNGYVNSPLTRQIDDEIKSTSQSSAKLYLYDNKDHVVCALPIKVYDSLYHFLNRNLPLTIYFNQKYNPHYHRNDD